MRVPDDPVFVLFVFFFHFRYEWSKFALFYPVSKSSLECKGGCMGTVKIKCDSSQIQRSDYNLSFNLLTCKYAAHSSWSQSVAVIITSRTFCKPVFCRCKFVIDSMCTRVNRNWLAEGSEPVERQSSTRVVLSYVNYC